MSLIESDKALLAITKDDADRANAQAEEQAEEWDRKYDEVMAARAKASGQPWLPSNTGSITFVPRPGQPTG